MEFSELIEDVILPPPGMQRRGREAKSGDFAIEKKEREEEENTDSDKSDAEVISDENDVNLLDQA